MQCSRCGKKLNGFFRDSGILLKLENGDVTVCPECFLKIKAEYETRKTCDDCAFFK
jgi:DNA-directed RNA polymerase subunit RPC12/RpoP